MEKVFFDPMSSPLPQLTIYSSHTTPIIPFNSLKSPSLFDYKSARFLLKKMDTGNNASLPLPLSSSCSQGPQYVVQQLFGGAFECKIPKRFQDVSPVRHVPDNQEVFADADSDQSIIVEIVEYQAISDHQAAR